ncbi:zinc finger MYM-type protein 1-like, partial [Aphis craccivora]
MSGSIGGVQSKCKIDNKNILYVHSYAHCLNLALVDAVCEKPNCTSGLKNSRCIFNFFGTIQFIYSFIEISPTRHAILENIIASSGYKFRTLKSLSTTRWACRAEAVNSVKFNYGAILIAIEDICSKYSVPEMRAKGTGLLAQMKSFEFNFGLVLMQPILQMVLKVSKLLQGNNLELLNAIYVFNSLKSSLCSMRNTPNNFENTYQQCLKICEEYEIHIPEVKKRKISSKIDTSKNNQNQHYFEKKSNEMRVTVFYTTLDKLINGIESRFNQESLQTLVQLEI